MMNQQDKHKSGKSLHEFLIINNLSILNKDKNSNFINAMKQKVMNITLITNSAVGTVIQKYRF